MTLPATYKRAGKPYLFGFAVIFALALLAASYLLYARPAAAPGAPPVPRATSTPAGAQTYTNTVYDFSLTLPAGFSAGDIPGTSGSGGDTVLLQNTAGDGIQITVSPFDEDTGQGYTLTKARILKDLPAMNIQNEQPVPVTPGYTGLSFITDDPTFGTSSRAVWFVYHGNLYQVSTYARLDSLLRQILSTWHWL